MNKKQILFFLLCSLNFYAFSALSQQPPASIGQGEGNPYVLYSDLDRTLSTNLPNLKEKLNSLLSDFKKGKTPPSLEEVKAINATLSHILERIRPDPNFDFIEKSLDEIRNSLSKAEGALQKKNLREAQRELQRSATHTKILLESPLLKMTEAEIDLDQASQRIINKDYVAAGLFLERALNHIQGLKFDGNPKLTAQLGQIRNNIVLVHQQTILGQYKDELANRAIWKQMRQAQVDSMSHYWDMWSNTYRTWDTN